MRRSASELIRSLEMRIARLEAKNATFNPSKLKKGDLVLYFAEGQLIRGEFQKMTGGGAEVVDVKAPRGVRMGRRIVDLHFLREDQELMMDKSARLEGRTASKIDSKMVRKLTSQLKEVVPNAKVISSQSWGTEGMGSTGTVTILKSNTGSGSLPFFIVVTQHGPLSYNIYSITHDLPTAKAHANKLLVLGSITS